MAYSDTIAQQIMGEIDGQIKRLKETATIVNEAARATNEAKTISYEKQDTLLQNYSLALAQLTSDHADRLITLTEQQTVAMTNAGDREKKELIGYAIRLRTSLVSELRAELTGVVKSELGRMNAVIHQFRPALDSYSTRIAELAVDLNGYAGNVIARTQEANAEATKQLERATTELIDRLYAQSWVFCGISALLGGVVAAAARYFAVGH